MKLSLGTLEGRIRICKEELHGRLVACSGSGRVGTTLTLNRQSDDIKEAEVSTFEKCCPFTVKKRSVDNWENSWLFSLRGRVTYIVRISKWGLDAEIRHLTDYNTEVRHAKKHSWSVFSSNISVVQESSRLRRVQANGKISLHLALSRDQQVSILLAQLYTAEL